MDGIRKHDEAMGETMLNEATKKVIVTEMAPPELAVLLKLNADKYSTHAQMKWERDDEMEHEDTNIDFFGRPAKGNGKAEGKGNAKGQGN